ncbi:putative cys/Met metabolism, pyridoxal phosphate-dependent enzyme [Helianthus annuus]|nr:putative methionine gamma-lyase, pyridoxal phosphate-dependent transferase, major [Helianthus annuus]KAJ0841157.1 putative cys/Met metabolism, pyridoxal phosphate-dependent enzyme [Helianthus annuus]
MARIDWDALEVALKPHTKCALIQRSCGHSWLKSLSVTEISKAIHIINVYNLSYPVHFFDFIIFLVCDSRVKYSIEGLQYHNWN